MKIEVPVRATITINGLTHICNEKENRSCSMCALRYFDCHNLKCDATDRSDGKNVIFELFNGVLFDEKDVIISIPEIKFSLRHEN